MNLFLVALDNRREWYRYHVLFGDVLRLSLTAEERIALHKRATGWFEARGEREPAMQHAALAADLLAAAAPARGAGRQALVEPLSERELEVLRLIAEGYANAEIGQKLCITTGTVKRRINNIYGKLGAGGRAQAVARARALDLLGQGHEAVLCTCRTMGHCARCLTAVRRCGRLTAFGA